jgi:hypothetical protein
LLRTFIALAILSFGLFLGIGSYSIPLYTVLGQPRSQGGLGLLPNNIATAAILASLAAFPALGMVWAMERMQVPRRQVLLGLLGLNALLSGVMATIVGVALPDNRVLILWIALFGFYLVNGATNSIFAAEMLESLPVHCRAALYYPLRGAGSVGFILAGMITAFQLQPVSPQPFWMAAVAFALLVPLCTWCLPRRPAGKSTPERKTGEHTPIGFVLSGCADLLVVVALCAVLARFFEIYVNPFLIEQGVRHASAVQTWGVAVEAVLLFFAPLWVRFRNVHSWLIVLGPACWGLVFLAFTFSVWHEKALFLHFGLPFQCANCMFGVAASLTVGYTESRWAATAQSLLAVIQGLGTVLGSIVSGWIIVNTSNATGHIDWAFLWLVAWVLSCAATVVALRYRQRSKPSPGSVKD